MPIYDYKCGQCGHQFEKIVKFSESEDEQSCPECGKNVTREAYSKGGTFHLKGSGWYKTGGY